MNVILGYAQLMEDELKGKGMSEQRILIPDGIQYLDRNKRQ